MNCPDCGGPMWDNRAKKESGEYKANRADLSCKDKDGCGKGIWSDGGGGGRRQGGGGQRGGQRGNGGGTPKNSRPLGPLYYDCLKVAKACVEKELKGATPTDVLSATATLFIAASRDGTPLTAPKAKPAPEPEYEEDQRYIEEDAGDSRLPF